MVRLVLPLIRIPLYGVPAWPRRALRGPIHYRPHRAFSCWMETRFAVGLASGIQGDGPFPVNVYRLIRLGPEGGRRHLMAKVSDRLRGGFDKEETGGALSGLLAEEDEFDRRTLWRLGTWAAVSVGAVVVALITNQSSIGMRHEQTASADLLKQAQQLQLTARESQSETRRLASAVDTLNSDRDRLYSRVGVLEQGLDSVTGAIARQGSASSPPQTGAHQASATVTAPARAAATPQASAPSAAVSPTAAVIPAATASVDPPAAKPSPAPPVVGPVAATTPAVVEKQDKEKQDKQASKPPTPAEPLPAAVASLSMQQPAPAQQPSGSLMASKSMMGPPDPAAGKLIEPAAPPKVVNSAPMPEVAAVVPKAVAETVPEPVSAAPELTVRRTEFGVDVGGANSIPGLRALWRGLVKSKANAALTKLRPIIVIKENTNGLGMQLRLVAGPITDAAAAAKICASLTVSDRSCSTAVFEGQRLAVNADEADKTESSKAEAEPDNKPASAGSKSWGHRHYYTGKHTPKVEEAPPKPEPSTFSSLIFGRRKQD